MGQQVNDVAFNDMLTTHDTTRFINKKQVDTKNVEKKYTKQKTTTVINDVCKSSKKTKNK